MLSARGAIVVLASSKTRAEIETWRARMDLDGPFISENGGALYVPQGFGVRLEGAHAVGSYQCLAWGTPYAELRRALPELAAAIGVSLTGFGDRTVEEIASITGLSHEDARWAAQRDWDEPFTVERPLTAEAEHRLAVLARARGLAVTRGGRFHHLVGRVSKGRAARALLDELGRTGRRVISIGLGDGLNDLELLQAVDHPVMVARPDGSPDPELRAALPDACVTRQPGPRGFAEAVAHWIEAHA
jgi:mannosyl-3-phosphoglycerate phosphatase